MPKPFAKWVGGKGQLLTQLLSRVPETFGTYHEPMVGGGALFFGLASEMLVKKATLNDLNADLVNVYRVVRENVGALISRLENIASDPKANTRKFFERIRADDPTQMDDVGAATRFIYLNRTCFNGLYRVNKKGQFNAPFGDYKNPKICNRENLIDCAHALQEADITCESFHHILERVEGGDFVYFDPPYVPVSETADFVSFTKDGFDNADHQILANVFAELANRDVYVMLSNSDTPFTRELYKDFYIDTVRARRSINSDGNKRGRVNEIIVRNY